MLVRAREDFQAMRKRMDNRIGRKADGTGQNVEDRDIRDEDSPKFSRIADEARKQEGVIAKDLESILKECDLYNSFLKDVPGCGPIAAGWIIGAYRIEEATTVSKLWQFTGLNPGMVHGKKRIDEGETFRLVKTDVMVRGDKLTPGFVAPFNKRLRTAMVGVLADGMIKASLRWREIEESEFVENTVYCKRKDDVPMAAVIGSKYVERYMQAKERALHQDNWKDEKPGHRDRHGKRLMIKLFLQDLYVAWRTIEGLPVRPPYQEEYLGHQHTA